MGEFSAEAPCFSHCHAINHRLSTRTSCRETLHPIGTTSRTLSAEHIMKTLSITRSHLGGEEDDSRCVFVFVSLLYIFQLLHSSANSRPMTSDDATVLTPEAARHRPLPGPHFPSSPRSRASQPNVNVHFGKKCSLPGDALGNS